MGNFKIFDIEKIKTISPRTGKELPFFLLNCQDWVNIIAITKENNIVMVKQHRFGTSKTELEIPGGIIEEGEEPMEAAKRELLEETGYHSNEFEYLGKGRLMMNRTNSLQHLFVAKNVIKTSNPANGIEVIKIPPKKMSLTK